jgi:6,7-dimethyl-8-ribityllumazine synthase
MNRIARYASLIAVGLLACFSFGCKKASVDPAVVEGASKLPGAAEVMAAIDKKDYEGAMAALAKVREGLTSEDQTVQYMVLARQARDKMSEAAATDPKAAEAVNTLRAMTTGGR